MKNSAITFSHFLNVDNDGFPTVFGGQISILMFTPWLKKPFLNFYWSEKKGSRIEKSLQNFYFN